MRNLKSQISDFKSRGALVDIALKSRHYCLVLALLLAANVVCNKQPAATTQPSGDSTKTKEISDSNRPPSPVAQPIASKSSNDWPQFRGDARNTGVAADELEPPLRVRWRFDTKENDSVTATAAIKDGYAFVGSLNGEFYALDLATGKSKWTFSTDDEAGIASSAAVDDRDQIYFGDEFGKLYCVDANDGSKKWQFETGAEIISSPQVHDDLVIFGSYDGTIYTIDRNTGKEKWNVRTEAQVHSTVGIADGKALAAGCDGSLHVLDIATGKEIRAARVGAQTASAVAIAGDRAYLGTLSSEVLCIDWSGGEIDWRFRDTDREFPFQSSAALYKNLVILGGRDKRVRALDAETGDQVWEFQTRARVDSSPVISGGLAFVGSSDGRLYAIDAAAGGMKWNFEAGGAISASPAIGGGVLVIGTEDGVIYCLEPEQISR